MFKDVPTQVWILLAVLAAAYVPALYVYRYIANAPSKQDVTAAPKDYSWRTRGQLVRSALILAGLSAFGAFIFTPQAAQFARSPSFVPLLILALGIWALSTVPKALLDGRVEPIVRGVSSSFERIAQPKRFWASVIWNGIFGCLAIWLGYMTWQEVPMSGLQNDCYNYRDQVAPKEALKACNELIWNEDDKADREMSDLLMARGSAYYGLKDYQKAKADYAESARLDPSSSAIWYNLGLVYEKIDDRQQAIAYYGKAIARNAKNDDAYLNRGLIYLDTGKFSQAIGDFTRVAELRPEDEIALANRGIAHVWNKDPISARRDFDAVEAIDPDNAVLLRGKALLCLRDNDLNGAIGYLTKAIEQNDSDMWALSLRADIYERLEEYDKAQADTDAILKINRRGNSG